MKRLLFDTEGNGLLPELTKMHCICAADVDTLERMQWGPEELPKALETLEKADKLIAHNAIGYDFPALEKLYGFKVPVEKQSDTLVIARTIYPNIKELDSKFNASRLKANESRRKTGLPELATMGKEFGKHSVAAWGIRLNCFKLYKDISDWSVWTPEMQERCAGDVETQLKLWNHLAVDSYPQEPIELEHRVARLCRKITEAGWWFDIEAAKDLHIRLATEYEALENRLKADFPGWVEKIPFTPKVNNKKRGYVKGVPTFKTKRIEFNPGSRPQIERALRDLGWQPTEFTKSGRAKLDEEQLEQVANLFPQAEPFVRYLMLEKRLGALANGKNAWLKTVHSDGKIHAEYNPMGAVTSRASHFNPNIAQVPAVSSQYGPECRGLFYVPDGWEALGADQAGLEGRCFSHYLAKYDGGAYGEKLLSGDPHWAVVLAVGYLTCERDKENRLHTIIREQGAKRLFYGMLYGCGDEKAGRIMLDCLRMLAKEFPEEADRLFVKFFGGDKSPNAKLLKRAGKTAKTDVIQGIDGFTQLKLQIDWLVEHRGFLPGLDKRRLPVRSAHAALNTLLQSAGAIICKRWICDAEDALLAEGFEWYKDFIFLGWIHDELQVACRDGLGERIGEVLTRTARKAGEPYGFRIPLDSDYKIGRTWADTH